ncbi:MAG: four helix bundle protein [Nanoarchaeota archaeon]|jgi:four helix bundle protein|nr:four helix bundle protein [Nanoarchaeota archaeon]
MQDFKELYIWKKSVGIAEDIYFITKSFPKEEIYGLISQMRRAVVSISSNIAESSGKRTGKEFRNFLYNATGSLKEVECQVIIAEKLGYLSKEVCCMLEREFNELGMMIRGFVVKLERSF